MKKVYTKHTGREVFPEGFKIGDMEALHKYHQEKLSEATQNLKDAQAELDYWKELESHSSGLAMAAMAKRWDEEGGVDLG